MLNKRKSFQDCPLLILRWFWFLFRSKNKSSLSLRLMRKALKSHPIGQPTFRSESGSNWQIHKKQIRKENEMSRVYRGIYSMQRHIIFSFSEEPRCAKGALTHNRPCTSSCNMCIAELQCSSASVQCTCAWGLRAENSMWRRVACCSFSQQWPSSKLQWPAWKSSKYENELWSASCIAV